MTKISHDYIIRGLRYTIEPTSKQRLFLCPAKSCGRLFDILDTSHYYNNNY